MCWQAGFYFLETIPEERIFKVHFGTLLHDVNLVNITFSTGVLSVVECNAKGFLKELKYTNGSKSYVLEVPFSDDVVLKHVSRFSCLFFFNFKYDHQGCCLTGP